MRIRLSKREAEYIIGRPEFPQSLRDAIRALLASQDCERIAFEMDDDAANNVRDIAGELFQTRGLENDEPNKEGLLLEDLVDVFFSD